MLNGAYGDRVLRAPFRDMTWQLVTMRRALNSRTKMSLAAT